MGSEILEHEISLQFPLSEEEYRKISSSFENDSLNLLSTVAYTKYRVHNILPFSYCRKIVKSMSRPADGKAKIYNRILYELRKDSQDYNVVYECKVNLRQKSTFARYGQYDIYPLNVSTSLEKQASVEMSNKIDKSPTKCIIERYYRKYIIKCDPLPTSSATLPNFPMHFPSIMPLCLVRIALEERRKESQDMITSLYRVPTIYYFSIEIELILDSEENIAQSQTEKNAILHFLKDQIAPHIIGQCLSKFSFLNSKVESCLSDSLILEILEKITAFGRKFIDLPAEYNDMENLKFNDKVRGKSIEYCYLSPKLDGTRYYAWIYEDTCSILHYGTKGMLRCKLNFKTSFNYLGFVEFIEEANVFFLIDILYIFVNNKFGEFLKYQVGTLEAINFLSALPPILSIDNKYKLQRNIFSYVRDSKALSSVISRSQDNCKGIPIDGILYFATDNQTIVKEKSEPTIDLSFNLNNFLHTLSTSMYGSQKRNRKLKRAKMKSAGKNEELSKELEKFLSDAKKKNIYVDKVFLQKYVWSIQNVNTYIHESLKCYDPDKKAMTSISYKFNHIHLDLKDLENALFENDSKMYAHAFVIMEFIVTRDRKLIFKKHRTKASCNTLDYVKSLLGESSREERLDVKK